ncbi:uncharacterized protein LOC134817520 isoform X2 [Bolinopsis microptera]|uniref:uncharacterized protein LOC134817520 isoform X2 n=1 Tax=Bolinopsis microptera TaxID=2820187 RepID=UPI003079137A
MPRTPPLLLLCTLTAWTAMAKPKAFVRGVEEERRSLAGNGGLCHNALDVYATKECNVEGDNCRKTGKCRLDNAGYVCCCDFCSRRSLNKSTNFCGDNGVTYTTLCEYRREQCETNTSIKILYKGQCNETCAKRRYETLLRQATGMMSDGYVPKCLESNMNLYALTQCNMTDGLQCWCVMPDTNNNITQPRPVSQEEDLNCEQEMKIAMLSCDPCKIVKEVFKAFPGANNYDIYVAKKIENTRRITRTHEPRSDVGIARKLFKSFDYSRDNFLSSGELDIIARWLYISRDCVLDVLSICDDNNDGLINNTEWCTCLMNRYSITLS